MASFTASEEAFTSITSADVPTYLHNSAFFAALSSEDTEKLTVPTTCFKADETVESLADAVHLLKTYRFWGVSSFASSLMVFILTGTGKESDPELVEFQEQFPYVKFLIDLRDAEPKLRMEQAAAFGSVETMHYLKSHGLEPTTAASLAAARNGHLSCLTLIHDWGVAPTVQVCAEAALHGKLDCLQFTLKFWKTFDPRVWASGEVTDQAVLGGHADCLRAANKKGCPVSPYADVTAANRGFLSCLEYIDSERLIWSGARTTAAAARAGHLDCLMFLHTHECEWDHTTIEAAASEGHLDCIMYAVENGCPRSASACCYAAGGHLPCLQYLHEQGFVIRGGAVSFAVSVGALDCLIYVHEHGCDFSECDFERAAYGGQLECLRYMHAHGCPSDTTATFSAAGSGHLACLQFLHESGCPWDYLTLYKAAEGRHPECVQYALDQGCPLGDQNAEQLLARARRT